MVAPVIHPPRKRDAQVFPNVNWQQFEAIEQSFESIPGVKFYYLDGALEIMTISPEHENFKATLRRLIEAYMEEANVRFYSRGGPSLGNQELGTRSEPDESYNLDCPKPYPDLVIEVVITSGGINKLKSYRRMEVAEVWFWEDGGLEIHRLGKNGYEKVAHSNLLPTLPLALFCRYITYHDQYDAVREFRQAIRSQNS